MNKVAAADRCRNIGLRHSSNSPAHSPRISNLKLHLNLKPWVMELVEVPTLEPTLYYSKSDCSDLKASEYIFKKSEFNVPGLELIIQDFQD
jgi:hypothetical protein